MDNVGAVRCESGGEAVRVCGAGFRGGSRADVLAGVNHI